MRSPIGHDKSGTPGSQHTTHQAGLVVAGATKSFGTRILWDDLGFGVPKGTMMAITGRSGSGKSTLLNCIGLLDHLDAGTVALDGETMSHAGERKLARFRRRRLGYLFQNYALIDNATVHENLDVAVGRLLPFPRRRPDSYEHCLERVGLAGRGRDLVFRLSGGEQQRVAVARLMLKKPQLVLADEPTGALDAGNADIVLGALREMAESGCSVIIATHSRDIAAACDTHLELTPAAAG